MAATTTMWIGVSATCLWGFLVAQRAIAQPPSDGAALMFEVASVKVAPPGPNGVRGGCRGIDKVYGPKETSGGLAPPPVGRCVITDARLSHLIGIAFDVSMQTLKTGPDWIQRGDLRYDIQAKAENPSKTTQKQMITMLQNLLVERFQLKFHYETKEEPGYILTVAKNGSKLKPSTSDETKVSFTGPNGESMGKPVPERLITITARKFSVPRLVELLNAVGGSGPGVDQTGLSGEYDFTLFWDQEGGPVLSTALRGQLGLVMKPAKVPVSTFVVDSAEKPTAN